MKALVIILFFMGAAFASGTQFDYEKAAKNALMPLKKNLMKTLMGEIKKNGPVAAATACNLLAPGIASKQNSALKEQGIKVGRTSHKIRNPKNAPASWMKSYLKEFSNSKKKLKAKVVQVDSQTVGYLEPIYLNKTCLQCHGENLSAGVKKLLHEKYPHDQATGFKSGEFRGFFWVTMPKL